MSYFFANFKELKEQFIMHSAAKNLVPETLKYYDVKPRHFEEFFGDRPLSDINEQLIERYIYHLKTKTNANDITINTYLRALKAILYYGMELGAIEPFKIHLIKADKKAKQTYSECDLERLVNPQGYKNMTEIKVWAIECFMLSTGVRISTILELKTNDIDYNKKICLLRHCKNRHQQIIPLTDSCIDMLKRYRSLCTEGNYLFSNTKGEKMDRRTLEHQIAKYNKARGVDITSAHAFRHTFAKMCVMNKIDVFTLQKLMGHSTISVTKEYVDLYGDDLRTNWSPLDTFKIG